MRKTVTGHGEDRQHGQPGTAGDHTVRVRGTEPLGDADRDEVDRGEDDQAQQDLGNVDAAQGAVDGSVELFDAQDPCGRRQQENEEQGRIDAAQGARDPGQGGNGAIQQGYPRENLAHTRFSQILSVCSWSCSCRRRAFPIAWRRSPARAVRSPSVSRSRAACRARGGQPASASVTSPVATSPPAVRRRRPGRWRRPVPGRAGWRSAGLNSSAVRRRWRRRHGGGARRRRSRPPSSSPRWHAAAG